MGLRKASPYLVVIQLILVVILLLQVNGISNTLNSITGDVVIDDTDIPAAVDDGEVDVIEIDIEGDPVKGDLDKAKVVIVEFSDFQCPFCGRATPTIEALVEKYGDDIAIVFKDFPLGFHENAQNAAEAAECADEQGLFWEYHDVLFDNQGALDQDSLIAYADDVGLDVEEFTTCLNSGAMEDEVSEDYNAGVEAGVRGTPAFFVNGVLISGAQPQSVFEAEIEKYL
ncbi:MAG: DsbA family protein [Nanoarchaeota archaeon]|nr:DsbA family protein [Nanoarchaeota archaeon]